jgi:thiol-disulfide isomerase/thioredoxin
LTIKRLFLGVCILFGVLSLVDHVRSTPHFASAPGALAVERLAAGGGMVHESFQPRGAPYLAVYHGASWCGPCQEFAPRLAAFYHDANKSQNRFQLLMVNYDRSEGEMVAFMHEHQMEFPAVLREEAGGWGAATGRGIPNLVIIETATGKVVSSSYGALGYQGCDAPLSVLRRIIGSGHP